MQYTYKNKSGNTYVFYGVTFGPYEAKSVGHQIDHPHMFRLPDTVITDPIVAKPITSKRASNTSATSSNNKDTQHEEE